MHRALVLFTVCLVAVYAEPTEEEKKCMRLVFHDLKQCCMRHIQINPQMDDIKECMQLPKISAGCERDKCIAVKKGFASEEGTINKDALKELVEKDLKDDANLVKLITENCVNGDLTKYGKNGPPDLCDVTKLKICMEVQYMASCPEWDNEGPCTGTKELSIECLKKFT